MIAGAVTTTLWVIASPASFWQAGECVYHVPNRIYTDIVRAR